MKNSGPISKLLIRLRFGRWITILFLTVSAVLVLVTVFGTSGRAILLSILSFALLYALLNPFSLTVPKLVRLLDKKYPELEFSAQLLEREPGELNALERLQYERVSDRFSSKRLFGLKETWPSFLILLICLLVFQLAGVSEHLNETNTAETTVPIRLQASGNAAKEIELSTNQFIITPPAYTGISSYTAAGPEIKVPEGSSVTWVLESTDAFDSASFIFNGDTTTWQGPLNALSHLPEIQQDGFLQFNIYMDSAEFRSGLYIVQHIEDTPPEIELAGQEEFTVFEWNERKEISLKAVANDDYGITNAFIVATVSRGSGESVRFREEQLELRIDRSTGASTEFSRTILLDSLEMIPGDELYYYLQVEDNRKPESLTGRTPTYFVQIRDTTSYEFALAGDLGAEVMPDYFRSQRQIIIDTEKLISERKAITEKEFKSRSNALGFDQKALRLRYSQFMGDEDEMMPAADSDDGESPDEDHDDHEGHDHDEPGATDNTENPLEEFMHDHGDPEEATFFRESLKAKLRRAMAEMWDAELYLRLYTPEESLPYQYRALELIREIKNDARIYVHRIGFEPPPIRPESRLSGDLAEVNPSARYSGEVKRSTEWDKLNGLIADWNRNNDADRQLILQMQSELVRLADKEPGLMIDAIGLTDEILRGDNPDREKLDQLYNEIMKVLPEKRLPVSVTEQEPSSLRERLILKK